MDKIVYTIAELDFNGDVVQDLEECETLEEAQNKVDSDYSYGNIAIYEDFRSDNGVYDSNILYTRINNQITRLNKEEK